MNKVLVVVDMQKDFVDGTLGTKEAVAIVPHVEAVAKTYLEAGDYVCFTQDTHTEDYLNTSEGKNLPVVHCVKGTDGWTLTKPLQLLLEGYTKDKDYVMLEKPIFGSTALVEYIRRVEQSGPVEVMMLGLCTDICVVSNALLLKSFYPEMPITVDVRGCAGVTPQTHEAAITTMKMCQITIKA